MLDGKIWGGRKNLGVSKKKRSSKKFGGIWPKNDDFRHISEVYRLEQSFFRSKKSKNKFLGLIFYFSGLKTLKNKV